MGGVFSAVAPVPACGEVGLVGLAGLVGSVFDQIFLKKNKRRSKSTVSFPHSATFVRVCEQRENPVFVLFVPVAS